MNFKKSFVTPTNKEIVDHFVIGLTKYLFKKKLSRKLKRLFWDLKSRPKDVRMSSISNEMKDFLITEQLYLANIQT